jgi:hypothetical protein
MSIWFATERSQHPDYDSFRGLGFASIPATQTKSTETRFLQETGFLNSVLYGRVDNPMLGKHSNVCNHTAALGNCSSLVRLSKARLLDHSLISIVTTA